MVRWTVGSNSRSDGTVISPDQKNPKKARVQAAHSMMLLCLSERLDQMLSKPLRMDGDIGRRCFDCDPVSRLMPLTTYCRRGKEPAVNGSESPAAI